MSSHTRHPARSGNVIVTTLFMLFSLLVIVALAVDLGYVQVVATQMQRTADAAAIAGAWRLLEEKGPENRPIDGSAIRSTAGQFAGLNEVLNAAPALATEDTAIGRLSYPFNQSVQLTYDQPSEFNAVKIRVRRTEQQNGPVGLFFARVMGIHSCELEAEATAAFIDNFAGFRSPDDGSNLHILPFALDETTWNALMAGVGTDNYRYDPDTQSVTSGSDGVLEVNLYPEGTGSPGNRGTVDIGSSNNSTADISRQIRYGITPEDLAHHGGRLTFDENGELVLNGDTGISAGVKDDLASIIGQPRIIPIFRTVVGPGNNAQYTIVKFCG
ncbi:MAG: Tad domain-containing protein, partial [Thermoguttaceae bacterium]|nr:Tad domain-containing protein [Thermoguttaceae bacterium]